MEDLFWELFQDSKISKASAQADDAVARSHDSAAHIAALSRKVERLALVCQGMWSLVREHTSLSEADLAERVTQLQGGSLRTGTLAPETRRCPHCATVLQSTAWQCYRCGREVPKTPAPFKEL